MGAKKRAGSFPGAWARPPLLMPGAEEVFEKKLQENETPPNNEFSTENQSPWTTETPSPRPREGVYLPQRLNSPSASPRPRPHGEDPKQQGRDGQAAPRQKFSADTPKGRQPNQQTREKIQQTSAGKIQFRKGGLGSEKKHIDTDLTTQVDEFLSHARWSCHATLKSGKGILGVAAFKSSEPEPTKISGRVWMIQKFQIRELITRFFVQIFGKLCMDNLHNARLPLRPIDTNTFMEVEIETFVNFDNTKFQPDEDEACTVRLPKIPEHGLNSRNSKWQGELGHFAALAQQLQDKILMRRKVPKDLWKGLKPKNYDSCTEWIPGNTFKLVTSEDLGGSGEKPHHKQVDGELMVLLPGRSFHGRPIYRWTAAVTSLNQPDQEKGSIYIVSKECLTPMELNSKDPNDIQKVMSHFKKFQYKVLLEQPGELCEAWLVARPAGEKCQVRLKLDSSDVVEVAGINLRVDIEKALPQCMDEYEDVRDVRDVRTWVRTESQAKWQADSRARMLRLSHWIE